MFSEEHVIYRYKYLPFSDASLKPILDATIKFTSPLEFNDPFDCFPYYDPAHVDNLPKFRPDLFRRAAKARGLSPAQRLAQRGEFVARLRDRIENGSFAKEVLGRVGVVSLSRNALSIPMWSHYADFHRGLVLEFRIPVLGLQEDLPLAGDRLLPFPITYSAQRPHIQVATTLPEDLITRIVLTKSQDWAYEEEERVVYHDRGPGIYPYRRDDILCTVIAGMRIPRQAYEKLESAVSEVSKKIPHLKLYRATAVADAYLLQVPGHPRLAGSPPNGRSGKS